MRMIGILLLLVLTVISTAGCTVYGRLPTEPSNPVADTQPSAPDSTNSPMREPSVNNLYPQASGGYDPGPPYDWSSLAEFEAEMQDQLETYNAIDSKVGYEDEAFRYLLELGYPSVEDTERVESFSFTYYPSVYWFIVRYKIDGITYECSYGGYNEQKDYTQWVPYSVVSFGGREITLYQFDDYIYGVYYVGKFRMSLSAENYENIEDVDFSQFTWVSTADAEP